MAVTSATCASDSDQHELQKQLRREFEEHARKFLLEMELMKLSLCGQFDLSLQSSAVEPSHAIEAADPDDHVINSN